MAKPARIIAKLRRKAKLRSFGVIDQDRRAAVEHGYLLALEDIEREMRPRERAEEVRRASA